MIKKLMLVPYFGDYPEWIDKYRENIKHLQADGYDWLFYTDLDGFSRKISDKLELEANITSGTSQSHNFRPAFGVIFEEELQGYDYWGITDLDCVYGDIKKFMPDEELNKLDIWSNHISYICGPWTLFHNRPYINELFRRVNGWEGFMTAKNSHPGRWTEEQFSRTVETADITYKYTHFQSHNPDDLTALTYKEGKLYDKKDEIMMSHFNRKKIWPI